jgi:hypothetical protein
VVGRQVSDQVVRALSVYRFTSGIARQLLATGYSRLTVCDLDLDAQNELFLLTHSSAEDGKGQVALYDYLDGGIVRSPEYTISVAAAAFSRFTEGKLEDGRQAMFVTCETEGKTLVTDVFVKEYSQMRVVARGITTQALQDYRVYPTDVDGDGVLEMPHLVPISDSVGTKKQNILQWYSLDQHGNATEKLYTYHNYAEGWFISLALEQIQGVCVEQTEDATVFSRMKNGIPTPVLRILSLTDGDREQQAQQKDRVVLYKSDAVIYAADITQEGKELGITLEEIKAVFFPIRGELTNEED